MTTVRCITAQSEWVIHVRVNLNMSIKESLFKRIKGTLTGFILDKMVVFLKETKEWCTKF